MKSQEQIEDRVRWLLEEELKQRTAAVNERRPHRCRHNHRQPLDHRRLVDGEANPHFNRISSGLDPEDSEKSLPVLQTIGLCMLGSENGEWQGNICEDDIDAQKCPYFEARQTQEEVYEQFLTDLQDEHWLVVNLPRIQPLLWVLGSRYEGLDEEPEPLPSPPTPPWYVRIWRALWNIQPEPESEPELPEGAPATVQVYLPPPGGEDVDEDGDATGEAADDGESTPSSG